MSSYYDIQCPAVDQRALLQNRETVPANRELPDGLSLVTHRSPLPLRRRVEQLARYFQREFGYDFVNYTTNGGPECEAWLWTSRADVPFCATGHAVFWLQHFRDRPSPEWELGSVWQHPYFRGHGRLSEVWPIWQARYGPFWVAHPWSTAMRSFMAHTPHEFPDAEVLS